MRTIQGDDGVSERSRSFQEVVNAGPGLVQLGAGYLRITEPVYVPANVYLQGEGRASVIVCDGPSACLRLESADSYLLFGGLEKLKLVGMRGALQGLVIRHRQHISLRDLSIYSFQEQGVLLDYTLMVSMHDCLIANCGSPLSACLEVDHSVSFHWYNCRVTGGNKSCVAGIRLDRTGPFILSGGYSESSGIGVQLASKPEAQAGVSQGVIHAMGLENARGCFVESGLGWAGRQGQALTRVSFLNLSCWPAGGSVPVGFRLRHTDSCYSSQCHFGVVQGTEIALEKSSRFSTGVQSSPNESTTYITIDGLPCAAARDRPWLQG
jgi:hypothetical protein